MASSIAMGKRDWNLVFKFIIEAEAVGILGGGCAEMFQETNEIRSEINMLSTTIVDLYTRQIAMYAKVQCMFREQKIQNTVSFVNAILACIPGGACSSFVTESIMKRFIRAGDDVVLEEETWNDVPEANRCAVEAEDG